MVICKKSYLDDVTDNPIFFFVFSGVFLLMIGGLCLIGSGVVMHFYDPYDLIFKWKLQFDEGGEIFGLWKDPPVEIFIKIYIFNITNAEAVMAGREKLRVEEVGPYVYKEDFKHTEVHFNPNDTMSTVPRHPLIWQPHLSQGRSEDDVFMLPNIALLVSLFLFTFIPSLPVAAS